MGPIWPINATVRLSAKNTAGADSRCLSPKPQGLPRHHYTIQHPALPLHSLSQPLMLRCNGPLKACHDAGLVAPTPS